MSVINTNYLSLVAQNNLQKSQSALGTAIERLSSGLRINSAKDDAAGQAIANRMGAQINGLNQAARNANDGISAAQTTEGALNQINDNLQRIRVLTVQASNGTNSGEDLTSIQNEIGQRLQEINRISSETEFNGVKVLSEGETLRIQVGANDGQTIDINLEKINVSTLGLSGFNVDGQEVNNSKASVEDVQAQAGKSIATGTDPVDYVLTTENTAVSGSELLSNLADGAKVTFAGNTAFGVAANGPNEFTFDADTGSFTYAATIATGGTAAIGDAITPATGKISATYELTTGSTVDINIDSAGTITRAGDNATLYVTATGELSENNGAGATAATVDNLTAAMDTLAVPTAKLTLADGTTFSGTGINGGVAVTNAAISAQDLIALAAADGANDITIANTAFTGAPAAGITIAGENDVFETGTPANKIYADGTQSTFAVTTSEDFDTDLYVGDDGSITTSATGNGSTLYVTADGELTFDAKSAGGRTENPLDVLDDALAQVDALRSDLGAIQNRFESAITNLQTTSNNLASAQSRIQDADYSVEVANMTRAQILQQAGTSVLAQANQIPQGVLSLLR